MKQLQVKFLAKNGNPGEVEAAIKDGLKPGPRYLVTAASISQSSSRIKVGGRWYNSVLFDVTVAQLIERFGDPYVSVRSRITRRKPISKDKDSRRLGWLLRYISIHGTFGRRPFTRKHVDRAMAAERAKKEVAC